MDVSVGVRNLEILAQYKRVGLHINTSVYVFISQLFSFLKYDLFKHVEILSQ